MRCEPPNSRLYHFTGNLEVESPLSEEGRLLVPVPPAAVLLRGCSLRNTHKVHGLVLYAGVYVCWCKHVFGLLLPAPCSCLLKRTAASNLNVAAVVA